MLLGVPLGELAWLALAVVLGGVVTGVLAGLFGIGGFTRPDSVVVVPIRLFGGVTIESNWSFLSATSCTR